MTNAPSSLTSPSLDAGMHRTQAIPLCLALNLVGGCRHDTLSEVRFTHSVDLHEPAPDPAAVATSNSTAERTRDSSGTSASPELDTSASPELDAPPARAVHGASIDPSSTSLDARISVVHDRSLRASELRLRLHAPNGPFGELTRRGLARNVQDGMLLVQLPVEYPTSHDAVARRHRACSYVIDCDSRIVQSLGEGLLPSQPKSSELVSFVSQQISLKSLSRGFDVASEVAASREGDCSEHAVLLTALARRYGLAARVVFGLAVLAFEDRLPMLVGHAWTEIHDGKRWRVADAALAGLEYHMLPGLLRLHYLPVSVLDHEGVGFQAKLLTMPNAFSIESAATGI